MFSKKPALAVAVVGANVPPPVSFKARALTAAVKSLPAEVPAKAEPSAPAKAPTK